jgi:hypothetical protein
MASRGTRTALQLLLLLLLLLLALPHSGECGYVGSSGSVQQDAPAPAPLALQQQQGDSDALFCPSGPDKVSANTFQDSLFTSMVSPTPRAFHTAVTTSVEVCRSGTCKVSHAMLVFGGCVGQGAVADLWKYNFALGMWSQLRSVGSGPSNRFGHAASTWNNGQSMVVFGGQWG